MKIKLNLEYFAYTSTKLSFELCLRGKITIIQTFDFGIGDTTTLFVRIWIQTAKHFSLKNSSLKHTNIGGPGPGKK